MNTNSFQILCGTVFKEDSTNRLIIAYIKCKYTFTTTLKYKTVDIKIDERVKLFKVNNTSIRSTPLISSCTFIITYCKQISQFVLEVLLLNLKTFLTVGLGANINLLA